MFAIDPESSTRSSVDRARILDGERYTMRYPHVVQPGCSNQGADDCLNSNPVSVVTVEGARVFFDGPSFHVMDESGNDIAKFGVGINDRNLSEYSVKDMVHLKGTTVLLGTSAGAHCYYHWMLDIMPKVGLLEKHGLKAAAVDNWVTREIRSSFQQEMLKHAGIRADNITESGPGKYFYCDKLVHVPIDNGINMKMNRFIPDWVNCTVPHAISSDKNRKLYISRPTGVRRGISNEQELLPILLEHGFEIVKMEGMSVTEQAQLLSECNTLVSPHGGALTNMVFARPGCTIVELFGRHVYPFYYGLAMTCGHNYHCLMENSDDYQRLVTFSVAQKAGSTEQQKKTRENSFDVNLGYFSKILENL